MKIYSMTATFGKLNHETLTLQPGLNLLEAPNEWGKSTWCAFLVAMLYGIDTKERTKQDSLAVKDHYAPWSGQPMSGSVDLCWNGRDITIQRRSKGRIPMGDFTAFETQSGLPIPELTADNCGKMLLGVERDVFTRAGFIRLSDMPVSNDDALQARLNALVTTGDESGTGEKLAQTLKELKNRCRHNKTGLLPKLEARQQELRSKLSNLTAIETQFSQATQQRQQLETQLSKLKNHQVALDYEAARAHRQQFNGALAARDAAALRIKQLETACADTLDKETARNNLTQLSNLQQQLALLHGRQLPVEPEAPAIPKAFAGLSAEEAITQATQDTAAYERLRKSVPFILPIVGLLCLVMGILLTQLHWLLLPAFALLGLVFVLLYGKNKKMQNAGLESLLAKYGAQSPDSWLSSALAYQAQQAAYQQNKAHWDTLRANDDHQKAEISQAIASLTGGIPVSECIANWNRAISLREDLENARLELSQAQSHAAALSAFAKEAPAPAEPDNLTLSAGQTAQAIADTTASLHLLSQRLGQFQGQAAGIGSQEAITRELDGVNARIARLEDVYAALEIAQSTLSAATAGLQRRFAPRISQRAKDLFSQLTQGRYTQLRLGEDLQLDVSAQGEDTLRGALWRSDGTADQLYLALRLAVAEELTPNAPLVLDDALVRFDDTRLAVAMDILKETARDKQVILFTCQHREANYT